MNDKRQGLGSVRLESGENFDPEVDAADLVVVVIDRQSVAEGAVGAIVDQLLKLSDSEAAVRGYEDRLAVVFTGYDDQPLWLCEEPALVAFMRQVHQHWPYWLHFLRKEVDVFDPVLSMLLEMGVDRTGDAPRRFVRSGANAAQVMTAMLFSMKALYDTYGLTADDGRRTEQKVKAVLDAWFGG